MSDSTSKASSNIQVLVRIRPMNDAELSSKGSLGRTNALSVIPGENRISVANDAMLEDTGIASGGKWRRNTERMRDINVSAREMQRKKVLEQSMDMSLMGDQSFSLGGSGSNKSFDFDSVLPPTCSQADTYDHVRGIVETCLQGYNGTIIAYGQTGSGKTHTVFGGGKLGSDPGLIQRSLKDLFNGIRLSEADAAHTSNTEYIRTITKASFYEIFNEKVHDLLSEKALENALAVREDAKNGVYVDGLTEIQCSSTIDAEEVLMKGLGNRHVAATSMNRCSSRSHAVFVLSIRTEHKTVDGVMKVRRSKFTLVDLAGSERQKLTDAAGERLKEASMINKSLTCLGHVINALSDIEKGKERHVHYRDSKLTFLLSDSLGGNSRTCLVATVSPSAKSLSETLSTLKFAQRAKLIRNSARVNEDTNSTIAALQAEIEKLRAANLITSKAIIPPSSHESSSFSVDTNKLTQTVSNQEKVIKSLKRKLQEEQMVQKLKQARIDVLNRKITGKSVDPDAEVKILCDEIDSLRRQLTLPSSEAIEWKSAYARDIDSDVIEPTKSIVFDNSEKLSGLESKISKLENEKKALQVALKQLEATSSTSMDEATKTLDDLDKKVQKLCSDLEHQKEMTNVAMMDADFEREKLSNIRLELNEAREKLHREQASGAELESEVDRLMDEIEALTHKLNDMMNKKAAADNQLEKLSSELEKTKEVQINVATDLQSTESQLRQDVATMSKDNAILLEKVKELTKEVGKRKKEFEKLEKKIETMKSAHDAEISLMETDNLALKRELENLSKQNSEKSTRIQNEHTEALLKLQNENDILRQRIDYFEGEIAKEDPRIIDLQSKLSTVIRERDDLEFERDALQEDQDTLTENIRFLTQQNNELEEENSHFRKVIGIDESFGSQVAPSNISYSDRTKNDVFSSPTKSSTPFKADQSPIVPMSGQSERVNTPLKPISTATKNSQGGATTIKKSTAKKSRTPFSDSKSRLNIPYIVQTALDKSSFVKSNPETVPEDSFDESMFLPNIGKENLATPFKSAKKSKEPSSAASKGDLTKSKIFRSNWSFAM